jgi:hypothetical protein
VQSGDKNDVPNIVYSSRRKRNLFGSSLEAKVCLEDVHGSFYGTPSTVTHGIPSCVILRKDVDEVMVQPPKALLTVDDLRSWKAEDGRLALEIDHLNDKISKIKQQREEIAEKLELASKLFGDIEALIEGGVDDSGSLNKRQSEKGVSSERKPTKRVSKGSWTNTILALVTGTNHPISYDELREMIMDTHLARTLEKTDKSFYGAIARLANSGKIIRESGHVFTTESYEQFQKNMKRGLVKPLPKVSYGTSSPTAEAIHEYLRTRPVHGATSGEIIAFLKTTDLREKIDRNKTFAYNVLSRMRDREEIVKSGDHYRLPNENGEALASPDSDEVTASSNETPVRSGLF